MGKIRIGLSGWSYDEWDGVFYPTDVSARNRLSYVADRFDTVEVNGTFYSLTTPAAVRHWDAVTRSGFVFAVKGSRYITHTKRLHDPAGALANFFASGLLELGPKLGPILWQLPPDLEFDEAAIDRFLRLLPHDTDQAAALARNHDDRVEDASYGDGSQHRIRHVIELRHESSRRPDAVRIARRHGVAIACSHSSVWPLIPDVTAGFIYIRLHGPGEIYASSYDDRALERWAERIRVWRKGDDVEDLERVSDSEPPERKERDVYVYFDNTAAGHAPEDARRLRDLLAIG